MPCPDASKLDRSSTLVLRSFTETILLTTYHKYVTSITLGVVVSGKGTSVYKRPRLHAGSTGGTPQRAPRACIDQLSRRGSITATSYAASIPQLPMHRGQTQRSACLHVCIGCWNAPWTLAARLPLLLDDAPAAPAAADPPVPSISSCSMNFCCATQSKPVQCSLCCCIEL